MFCIICLCVGLKNFFSKPKRLVDLVVWTHFLRYRRRALAHALWNLRSQPKVVRPRDWVKNMEGPIFMPFPYIKLKSFFWQLSPFSFLWKYIWCCEILCLFFSIKFKSHNATSLSLQVVFAIWWIPWCHHFQAFGIFWCSFLCFESSICFHFSFLRFLLMHLCINATSMFICINASFVHLLCMGVVSMLHVHLHHVVA